MVKWSKCLACPASSARTAGMGAAVGPFDKTARNRSRAVGRSTTSRRAKRSRMPGRVPRPGIVGPGCPGPSRAPLMRAPRGFESGDAPARQGPPVPCTLATLGLRGAVRLRESGAPAWRYAAIRHMRRWVDVLSSRDATAGRSGSGRHLRGATRRSSCLWCTLGAGSKGLRTRGSPGPGRAHRAVARGRFHEIPGPLGGPGGPGPGDPSDGREPGRPGRAGPAWTLRARSRPVGL
jgi:hypothetical protein